MTLFYLLGDLFLLHSKSSYNLKLLLFNIYVLPICLDICEFNTKVKSSGAKYFSLKEVYHCSHKNVYYHPYVHISILFNYLHVFRQHMIMLGIPLD